MQLDQAKMSGGTLSAEKIRIYSFKQTHPNTNSVECTLSQFQLGGEQIFPRHTFSRQGRYFQDRLHLPGQPGVTRLHLMSFSSKNIAPCDAGVGPKIVQSNIVVQ